MPCHVYFEGEILRSDFIAPVNDADFAEMVLLLEQFEQGRPAVPHRITDLSKSSGMNVGFPSIFALAERRKATQFANSFKSAIVAPQPVQLGLARMFQIANDHPQITIKIFPDVPAALAWISAP